MKTHIIRKLKNKVYPKRDVPNRLWGKVMDSFFLPIQNDTDND